MREATPPVNRSRTWLAGVLACAALCAGLVAGERLGWPWLVTPTAAAVGRLIGRQVEISPAQQGARIHFWRGLSFSAPTIKVAGPNWGKHPWMLAIEDGQLHVGYGDLWRMYRGDGNHIQMLRARRVSVWLERDKQGRASWHLGQAEDVRPGWAKMPAINLSQLEVQQGLVHYQDKLLNLDVATSFSLIQVPGPAARARWQFAALAKGLYGPHPLYMEASSTQPWVMPMQAEATDVRWPVRLQGQVGQARLGFDGAVGVALWAGPLRGRFSMAGPSLAAVGEAVGLTLPTTAAFDMKGRMAMDGPVVYTVVDHARIGQSRLGGAFAFHRETLPPKLMGKLHGTRLMLADLGPAVGVPVSASGTPAPAEQGRVLPERTFNLPSLKAMDADVVASIDVLDTGSAWLKPMTALKGRIVLSNAVLRLEHLTTKLAKGEVRGEVSLDARNVKKGVLQANLAIDQVRLEEWATPLQRTGKAPYLSGMLAGRVDVTGTGNSTAALLSSLNGTASAQLGQGQVSHLLVELAGLDAMQGMLEFLKGDESLSVECARSEWVAKQGVLRPETFVVSTRDSTLVVDGSVSIPQESLDLRARVSPKDLTLLALRTPIRVQGSWRDPDIDVFNRSSWARLLGAAALAAINPIAGVIPLVDAGQREDARKADVMCRAAARRS